LKVVDGGCEKTIPTENIRMQHILMVEKSFEKGYIYQLHKGHKSGMHMAMYWEEKVVLQRYLG